MSRMKKVSLISAIIIAPILIWFVSAVLMAVKAQKFMSSFEKINETKPPLSIAQVEQLMGQPLRIEHAESIGIGGDVYHYPTYPPGGDFQVIFVNGVVFHTAFPSPTKS